MSRTRRRLAMLKFWSKHLKVYAKRQGLHGFIPESTDGQRTKIREARAAARRKARGKKPREIREPAKS